jgi:hypothetical protein
MEYTRTTPEEPSLGSELRGSALLFGLSIFCTAGAVGVTQLAIKAFA